MTVHAATVHCVGIGGSGVSALAELLVAEGIQVTGSDVQQSPVTERLKARGLQVRLGHCASNVPQSCGLVIYSPAIHPTNPELLAAQRRGIPVLSLSEAVGRLMEQRVGVAIAGTHGKSTTTALLGHILIRAGLDPTVIVGAMVPEWSGSARAGRGPLLIAEACEYARSFLSLRPRFAAVLNIDADHLDYYASFSSMAASYQEFVQGLPSGGFLLLHDSPGVRSLQESASCRVETFGQDTESDWRYEIMDERRGRFRYRLYRKGTFALESRCPLLGEHNVANTVAAVVMASRLGVPLARAVELTEAYRPCSRRLEFLGFHNGVAHYDDYAHHPAAVRCTLKTLRLVAGKAPLWCVFQAHQLWRAVQFAEGFADALSLADGVILLPVYPAREAATTESCAHVARKLAGLCRRSGQRVYFAPTLETAALIAERVVPPGSVLVTMGAGDVWKVRNAAAARTRAHCKAG